MFSKIKYLIIEVLIFFGVDVDRFTTKETKLSKLDKELNKQLVSVQQDYKKDAIMSERQTTHDYLVNELEYLFLEQGTPGLFDLAFNLISGDTFKNTYRYKRKYICSVSIHMLSEDYFHLNVHLYNGDMIFVRGCTIVNPSIKKASRLYDAVFVLNEAISRINERESK